MMRCLYRLLAEGVQPMALSHVVTMATVAMWLSVMGGVDKPSDMVSSAHLRQVQSVLSRLRPAIVSGIRQRTRSYGEYLVQVASTPS